VARLQGTIAENLDELEDYEVLWAPHKGPQTRFCAASEFEVFYGGAKGGGKSDAIIAISGLQIDKPRYRALVLRETFGEVEELILRSQQLYRRHPQQPHWSGEHRRWRFPSGAFIQFGYCARLDDVERYQGREWAAVLFDELANIPEERIWVDLLKEIRCPDPTVIRMARGTGNPGFAGHAWTKKRFVNPCGKNGERVYVFENKTLDGEVFRLTRRYIPARISDNPIYANDPAYLAVLNSLPELRRRQLLDGDWDVGAGMALGELDHTVHTCDPFEPPEHWYRFGGFDWGFAHPWVAVELATDEDGRLWVVDTVKGHRQLPDEIAERISRKLSHKMRYMAAGHDCWHTHKARGESTPSVAEKLIGAGIPLSRANQDRVHGLNNLRDYIGYRGRGPNGEDWEPGIRFMRTDGNMWLLDQLQSMVTDPDDTEVVLKVDADPDTGEGGDDGYDALRYAVASRAPRSASVSLLKKVRAWDPDVLIREANESRRVRPPGRRDREYDPLQVRE
jgi:hypothetical protein